MAGVSVADSQTLAILPYDQGALKDVERALSEANLGATPSCQDGKTIRLAIPPLTSERRAELAKEAQAMGEEGKVAVRGVRQDAMTAIKKLKAVDKKTKKAAVSEDEAKDMEADVQAATDAAIKEIDELVKAKQAELKKV